MWTFCSLIFWPFLGECQSHFLSGWSWHGHLSPRIIVSATWGALWHLSKNRAMRINGGKLICHANCLAFEAAKLVRTWIKVWKTKTWVKTKIPWERLLLRAPVGQEVGGLQSLLPEIKLLKIRASFLCWFSSLDPLNKKWCFRLYCFAAASSFPPQWSQEAGGAPQCNLTSSGQSLLGAGVCSRGNLCDALPSTGSPPKLTRDNQGRKTGNSEQNYHCLSFSLCFKKRWRKAVENKSKATHE